MWAISRGSNAQILFHPLTSSLADGVLWRDPSAHPCFEVLELLLQCSCKVLKSFVCRAGDWVTYLEWSCKESMNKREEKNDKSNRWNLWVLRGNFSLFFFLITSFPHWISHPLPQHLNKVQERLGYLEEKSPLWFSSSFFIFPFLLLKFLFLFMGCSHSFLKVEILK